MNKIRALLKLTWLEIKIFVREPMGVFGTIGIPVIVFLIANRLLGPRIARTAIQTGGGPGSAVLPVLASLLMALSAISSLVTIISIYREGGILKRLRATPLSPGVILSAHVLVARGRDCHAIRARLDDMVGDQFGISHTTMQVDHAGLEHRSSGIKPYTAHCQDAHGPAHTVGEHEH